MARRARSTVADPVRSQPSANGACLQSGTSSLNKGAGDNIRMLQCFSRMIKAKPVSLYLHIYIYIYICI